jgi:dTMP kinase
MLIAFEGLDQSGKETQARQLRAWLQDNRRSVRAVSFPDYDTPIGRELRLALDGGRDFGPEVMQLLYVANRFEYKPRLDAWLAAGETIVCDRYTASSIAYGEAMGLDPHWLTLIQQHLPAPALTIWLDLLPERALERKRVGRDRFERDLDLLGRVRASYRRQATASDWVTVDADQPQDRVRAAIVEAIGPALARLSAP